MMVLIMKNALLLLEKFHNLGYQAYIVGGSVRDQILKRDSFDIDIATNATPDQIMNHFKSKPIGLKYGTVLVFFKGEQYEVTTFRKDLVYFDNRHPDGVVFSNDINEDASRRDFTINGLYMDHNMNVIDIVNGVNDLNDKKIKTIGNPDDRFREDALRMLRAFYLVSKLNFDIDKETFSSIIKNRELIKNVSSERVYRELEKIVTFDYSMKSLNLLVHSGIYLQIPGISQGIKYLVDNDIDLKKEYFFSFCFLKAGKVDKYWKFSNHDKNQYKRIIDFFNNTQKIDNKRLFGLNEKDISIIANINSFLKTFQISEAEIHSIYEKLPIKDEQAISLSNDEIISIMGIDPGPWLSRLRSEIIDLILSGGLENSYQEVLKYVKRRKDIYDGK